MQRALEGASSARAAMLFLFYKYLKHHIIFSNVCAIAQGGVHGGQPLAWTSSLMTPVLVTFLHTVTKSDNSKSRKEGLVWSHSSRNSQLWKEVLVVEV